MHINTYTDSSVVSTSLMFVWPCVVVCVFTKIYMYVYIDIHIYIHVYIDIHRSINRIESLCSVSDIMCVL